jgi:DNA-binding response OmpR family regulator
VRSASEVLPALNLLSHTARILPAERVASADLCDADVVLVDGRRDLVGARALCRVLRVTRLRSPVIVVLAEGGLVAVSADWGVDDFVVTSAEPAEVEARVRLVIQRAAEGQVAPMKKCGTRGGTIWAGGVTVDEMTYRATVRGRSIDLTCKEFELLRYLIQHPGRVYTRAQLLQDIWGLPYLGGTRTIDVHIRRLRSKLGPEDMGLISTVRGVGYRFETPDRVQSPCEPPEPSHASSVSPGPVLPGGQRGGAAPVLVDS